MRLLFRRRKFGAVYLVGMLLLGRRFPLIEPNDFERTSRFLSRKAEMETADASE
jgi:hypothetical protein